MQKEERLKQEKAESAHLAITFNDKNKKRKKDKEATGAAAQKKQQKKQGEEFTCYFCRGVGHKKKQCINYHAWCAKKGTFLTLVCFEVNLTLVPRYT